MNHVVFQWRRIAIVFLLCWLSCCSEVDIKKQAYIERGLEYMHEGQLKEAALEFRNAIQLDPQSMTARYHLGLIYLEQGAYQEAFGQLKLVSDSRAGNLDAHLKVAEFYLLQERLAESRQYVDKILNSQPAHAEALAVLATIELFNGNIQRAELAVEKALVVDDHNARLYVLRAKILNEKKVFSLVEKDLLQAITLDPANVESYELLATFYVEQGDEKMGEAILESMVEIFPHDAGPRMKLAAHLFRKNRLTQAHSVIHQAIALHPNDERTYLQAAKVYEEAQQYDDAENLLKEILAKSDNPLPIMERLANVSYERQQYTVAEDIVQTILAQDSELPLANLLRAKLYIRQDDHDRAVELLENLLQRFPRWGEAYFYLSLAELKRGNIKSSREAVHQAASYRSEDSRVHALLAHHHLLVHEVGLAEQEAAAALQLDHRNIQAAIILGQSYLYSNQSTRAQEVFEQLNELLPDNPEIIYYLALVHTAQKKLGEALVLLEHVLKLQPSFHPALAKITEIYSADRTLDRAIERVRGHIRSTEETSQNLLLLAELCYRQGSLDQAVSVYRKIHAGFPMEPRAYTAMAAILEERDDIDSAIAEYNMLLQLKPKSLPALMGLGVLMEKIGQTAEAKTYYRKILTIDENFAPAANNLSWLIVHEEQGDLEEALRLAKTAERVQPDSPAINDTLGLIYYRQKYYGQAFTRFREAIAVLPQAPTIRYHLALALKAMGAHHEALYELRKCLASPAKFSERSEAQRCFLQWQEDGKGSG